jgi:aminoglycoside phosphotransferase (APT) family kinase protein
VPEVFWLGADPSVLGACFFIMERIDGETLARRLLRDAEYAEARRVMPAQLGAILARIHAIDAAAERLDFLAAPDDGQSPAAVELGRYEQVYRAIAPDPHPVIELAIRWLAGRVPRATRLTVVHGDYRIGNAIFGPEGVRAILDWELAHRGDPMEDLGWMCVKAWRYGSPLPVGGIGERADFFRAYEDAGGGRVDAEVVHFWEVFGNLKWAIVCMSQAKTHLDGVVPSVELASLGRRTAEVEHELLCLID